MEDAVEPRDDIFRIFVTTEEFRVVVLRVRASMTVSEMKHLLAQVLQFPGSAAGEIDMHWRDQLLVDDVLLSTYGIRDRCQLTSRVVGLLPSDDEFPEQLFALRVAALQAQMREEQVLRNMVLDL